VLIVYTLQGKWLAFLTSCKYSLYVEFCISESIQNRALRMKNSHGKRLQFPLLRKIFLCEFVKKAFLIVAL